MTPEEKELRLLTLSYVFIIFRRDTGVLSLPSYPENCTYRSSILRRTAPERSTFGSPGLRFVSNERWLLRAECH